MSLNRAENPQDITELIFLTPVPANKMELFGT